MATEAVETATGRTVLVVAAAPIGITTYNANGDPRRCRCPDSRRDDDDVGRKVGVKRGRGDYKATTRQQRGNKDATAIGYGAAGGRGNEAIDKRITNNIVVFNNKSDLCAHLSCLISA